MNADTESLYFRALAGRGKVLDLISKFSEAIDDYSRIIESHGRIKLRINAYIGTGQAQMKCGKFHAALQQVKKAYALARKNALRLESVRTRRSSLRTG